MYQEIKPRRVADEVMEQLQRMILDGMLKTGQRLPPERELAEQFGVSRPSVREAIQKLAAKGLLTSRQGGGNYVAEQLGNSFYDPLITLLEQQQGVHFDLLEFRHTIETATAFYAAQRGTDADSENITRAYDRLMATYQEQDQSREAAADAAFHLAIAEAAHNVVFYHTMKGLFDLLKRNVITNLGGLYTRHETRDKIMAQHEKIYQAIMARDEAAARSASSNHMRFVEDTLMELEEEKRRQARAELRLKLLVNDEG